MGAFMLVNFMVILYRSWNVFVVRSCRRPAVSDYRMVSFFLHHPFPSSAWVCVMYTHSHVMYIHYALIPVWQF